MTRCIEKYRNNNGVILGYLLIDVNTCQTAQVESNELKKLIKSGRIKVENLTLTRDGRLVESGNIKTGLSPNKNVLHRQNIENNKQLHIYGVRPQAQAQQTQQMQESKTHEQLKAQEKRKKTFNKTIDFMKDVGCILFMGKTLDEHREEKVRRGNRRTSWEDNHHELNEYFDTGGEFGGCSGGEFN